MIVKKNTRETKKKVFADCTSPKKIKDKKVLPWRYAILSPGAASPIRYSGALAWLSYRTQIDAWPPYCPNDETGIWKSDGIESCSGPNPSHCKDERISVWDKKTISASKKSSFCHERMFCSYSQFLPLDHWCVVLELQIPVLGWEIHSWTFAVIDLLHSPSNLAKWYLYRQTRAKIQQLPTNLPRG